MRLHRLVSALFLALVLAVGEVGLGQETDTRWLIGIWKGQQTRTAYTTQVEAEFKSEGGEVRWDLEVTTQNAQTSKARGTAKVSGETVTMQGQYYAGPACCWGLSYTLSRKGNVLEGTGIGANSATFQVYWRKGKEGA